MGAHPRDAAAWTHRTALVLIPPGEVWPAIQEVRRAHDRQFVRWMPHVTLLYPFAPRGELPALLPALREACAALAPFEARLGTFGRFTHRGGRTTLWLAPEPREAFVRLQAALERAAPAYGHTSRFPGGFTPHLSVGQAPGHEAAALAAALGACWRPLVFRVAEVQLIAREGERPFEVVERLRLGAPAA